MAADNVYVVAGDGGDFGATVASSVALDEYDDVPGTLSGHDEARVWGVDDEDLFEEMDEGDLVLFYGDGRYVGVGTVGTTFHDADGWAADALWEDLDAAFLFTLAEFDPVDLSRAAVHAIFDYSANYYPSTPMGVPGDRVDNSLPAIHEAVRRYEQRA
jgi:putative restriction endonuclease